MEIIHAISMAVGCALGFTAYLGLAPQLNDAFRALGQVYCVIMGVVTGTALTGCTALALRRRTGDTAAMTRPGHWLLSHLVFPGPGSYPPGRIVVRLQYRLSGHPAMSYGNVPGQKIPFV